MAILVLFAGLGWSLNGMLGRVKPTVLLQRFFWDHKTGHLGSPGAVPSDPKAMAGRILIMFDGTRGDLQPLVIAARALIEGGGWPKEIFFCLGCWNCWNRY